jgi:hypothetical protein
MIHLSGLVKPCGVAAVLAAAASAAWCADAATDPKPPAPATEPKAETSAVPKGDPTKAVEFDVETMLRDFQKDRVNFGDGIWTLTPPPGRKVLLLPLRLMQVDEPTLLDPGHISIANGQFAGWYVPKAANAPAEPPLQAGDIAINTAVPRLARDVVLTPNNTVQWKYSRSFSGGKVGGNTQLYAIATDRTLLGRPETPKIPPRAAGQNAADYNRMRAEVTEKSRKEMAAFTTINKALSELPMDFESPAPPDVFAIYYVQSSASQVAVMGPEPLPWRTTNEQLDKLHALVSGSAALPALKAALPDLVSAPDVNSHRVAALMLAGSNTISVVPADDAELLGMIDKLLSDKDTETRHTVVRAMLRTASAATPKLLPKTLADPDPAIALLALRIASKSAAPSGPELPVAAVVKTVTRLLADASAPSAVYVLASPIEIARKNPKLIDPLVAGIDLAAAHADRRAEMIEVILQHARRQDPFALRLLDRGLLASKDAALAKLTLEALIVPEPAPAKPAAAPGAALEIDSDPWTAARDCQFVPPNLPMPNPNVPKNFPIPRSNVTPRPATTTPTPATPVHHAPTTQPRSSGASGPAFNPEYAPAAADADDLPPAELPTAPVKLLALDSPTHGLIALLSAKDAALRAAAWTALGQFVVGLSVPLATGAEDPIPATFDAIVDAAVKIDPTPRVSIEFIKLQTQEKPRAKSLGRLLAEGHGPVRDAALLAITKSGTSAITATLLEMDGPGRQELAQLWYESDKSRGGDEKPAAWLLLGLMRQPGPNDTQLGPVVTWFAQQMADGKRPGPLEWVAAAGNMDGLLAALVNKDEAYGRAAAAAIIATSLPTTEASAKVLYSEAAKITAATPAEQKKLVVQTWKKINEDLINEKLKNTGGSYAVDIRVVPPIPKPDPKKPKEIPVAPEPRKYSLGSVRITVNARQLTFEPVKINNALVADPGPVRIQWATPAQLAELPAPDGQKVPIAWPNAPMDLFPDASGRWSGTTILADLSKLEVTLSPGK